MYKWFERYFAFSRRELNGICVLGVLLFVLWLTFNLFSRNRDSGAIDMDSRIKEIEHFLATVAEENRESLAVGHVASEPMQRKRASADVAEYFTFDPNGLPVAEWKRLGLSDGQIRMIKNYEAKGGRFWKKEDLQKIYALRDTDYTRLEPYIRIPSVRSKSQQDENTMPEEIRSRLSIELNAADSLELQQLPGIGPVYASRIVRFRNLLGGFHHVTQLMDVYGMDTTRFERLKEHIYVYSAFVKKIELNSADYERLRNHPFISPKLANAIVQFRKQHGPYQSLADLLRIEIMNDEIFCKIVPYLTISDD